MKMQISILTFFMFLLQSCGGDSGTSPNPMAYPIVRTNCNEGSTIEYSKYIIENNQWGRAGAGSTSFEQCITVTETAPSAFIASWNYDWPIGTGQVKAYPEIYYGSKFGSQSPNSPDLPARIDLLSQYSITFHYEESNIDSSDSRNIAFESWFFPTSDVSFEQVQDEMMVWLNKSESFYPGGQYVGDVTIDGAVYKFYTGPFPNWTYFAFVREIPVSQGTINWNSFVNYLVQNSYLSSNKYMAGIEFGTEIISGQGTFAINQFDVQVQ